jgi:hypothetical protein
MNANEDNQSLLIGSFIRCFAQCLGCLLLRSRTIRFEGVSGRRQACQQTVAYMFTYTGLRNFASHRRLAINACLGYGRQEYALSNAYKISNGHVESCFKRPNNPRFSYNVSRLTDLVNEKSLAMRPFPYLCYGVLAAPVPVSAVSEVTPSVITIVNLKC